MATSPNYGWLEPDNTDLVKNGALAIRTLGNAIDTTMATMTPKSIVDAKGDLIAASAADTPARLAVGNNGETLVADSSTSTGLRYQGSIAAGKNFIINGNFDIWQRGTSFTIVNNNAYTADRFHASVTGTMTISRQTTGVPAGSQYCLRMASGFTNSVADFFQYIETANVVPLQGKTVTYSIKLRKNAANTSDAIILIQKSATTDAGSGASWSTISSTTVANALLPTGTGVGDWYTASLTLTIPNDGTANSLRVYASTVAQIANTAYLELAQSQVELGSVATTFSRAGGTIQGELAACQRYFYVMADGNQQSITNGFYSSTTDCRGNLRYAVTMRSTPTLASSTGTDHFAFETSAGVDGLNTLNGARITNNSLLIYNNTQASGTAGNAGELRTNSASASLTASAEL